MPTPIIELHQAERAYGSGAQRTLALRPTDLRLYPGDLVALTGRSGSGKSTLLNLIGGIDRPSAGSVTVAGQSLGALGESALARWRGRHVGIVFQFFELLPTLTALENVLLALELVGRVPRARRRAHALALLDRLGIAALAQRLPSELSGGEQQRVAIARALANTPPLLIADEPCGNLDSQHAAAVHDALRGCADAGTTVIVATHERGDLARYDRVLHLADGALVDDRRGRTAAPLTLTSDASTCA